LREVGNLLFSHAVIIGHQTHKTNISERCVAVIGENQHFCQLWTKRSYVVSILIDILLLRKVQHRLWLEREAIAQERFRKKKEDEERKLREKLEQEVIDYV